MSSVTLVLDLKDKATPALLKAAHAAKSLAGQNKAIAGLQDDLRRVAKEAERVRIGPEQFAIQEAIQDLDRLEAKLKATNSLTDTALSTITTRRAQLTSKAADRTGKSLSSMGDRAHEMGEQFGDADSALVGFSSVLDLVNPKLGSAVRVAADVGASLEGMIRVVRVGLPLVTALGAAASVGAIAYTNWADRTERLKKNLEASSAAMETQRSMVEKIRSAQLDLDVALGAISESEAEIARIRREAFIESLPAVQALTKQITEQQLAVEKLEQQQASAATTAKTMATTDIVGPGGLSMPARGVGAAAQAVDLSADIIKETAALDKLVAKQRELVAQTSELVAIQIATAQATENTTIASDRATIATDQFKGRVSALGSVISGLPQVELTEIERLDQARIMIADLRAEMDRLGASLSAADTAKFESMIAGYETALQQATEQFLGDPVELHIEPKISTDEYIEQLRSANEQAGGPSGPGAAGIVTQAASAVSSPGSALSMLGPWGAAAGAVIGGLSSLGARDPETGRLQIKERTEATMKAVTAGLKALPKILSNFAPWFLNLLVTKVLPGLLKAILGIPKAIFKGALNLHKVATRLLVDLIVGLRDAFRQMLTNLWDRIRGKAESAEDMSGWQKFVAWVGTSAQVGAAGDQATRAMAGRVASQSRIANSPGRGSNVFSDPMATVVRRQQTTNEAGSVFAGGAGGVVVNISGSLVDRDVVDRLGRELNRQFGSYGMSSQPIFSS